MNKKRLINLLKRNEGEKLDFKEKIELYSEGSKRELAKDICAIANSRGGVGYIIIGIRDKTKEIVGVEKSISEERLQQIVSSRCDPPIPVGIEEVDMDGRIIIIIEIYNGYQKPYQIRENGAFYIRRGSTTDIMRKQELITSFQEGMNFGLEICPLMKSSIGLLNFSLIERYFTLKGVKINNDNKDFLLEMSKIIHIDEVSGEKMCTIGGLLVFSDLNNLLIPHNMIKIINKTTLKEYNVIIVQGNLIDMIDKTEKELRKILPSKYPIQAVLEGIKNAVLYRDYSEMNKVIEVMIRKNSIVITSPGKFIRKRNNKSISYYRRNMWIYEKLMTLDERGRFLNSGSGFNVMKSSLKNIGKIKVIEYKEENCVVVIFPGIEGLE